MPTKTMKASYSGRVSVTRTKLIIRCGSDGPTHPKTHVSRPGQKDGMVVIGCLTIFQGDLLQHKALGVDARNDHDGCQDGALCSDDMMIR